MKRRALLVGNKTVLPESGLLSLRGPLNDVSAMTRVLGDPELGGFDVQVLSDRPSGDIKGGVEDALYGLGSGDTLLVYFSGHGTLDFSGRLCLVTSDTVDRRLYSTSLPTDHLRDLVSNSRCDAVILILDCCFSGTATKTKGAVDAQLAQSVREASGLYILSGTGTIQPAEEAEIGDGVYMGRFTSAIVDGIESGTADRDRDGRIGLTDIAYNAREALGNQTPRLLTSGTGDPMISRSRFAAGLTGDSGGRPNLEESLLIIADHLDEWTYKNLRRITREKVTLFKRTDAFDRELRTLRDRGLIVVPAGVSAMPRVGKELMKYVQASPLGREVVRVKERSEKT